MAQWSPAPSHSLQYTTGGSSGAHSSQLCGLKHVKVVSVGLLLSKVDHHLFILHHQSLTVHCDRCHSSHPTLFSESWSIHLESAVVNFMLDACHRNLHWYPTFQCRPLDIHSGLLQSVMDVIPVPSTIPFSKVDHCISSPVVYCTL